MRYFFLILIFFLSFNTVIASSLLDSDKDGILDRDELDIYKTDINNHDTDNDGYSDWLELNNGYSPFKAGNIKLEESDYDNDGLTDKMELDFHTDLSNTDTDGDGFSDGVEIENGYDPLNSAPVKLSKRIEVDLSNQELHYFLGGVRLNKFIISSGINNSTPKGFFRIDEKQKKAWSSFGLWMPFWMSFLNGYYGIHELPEWPDGRKEGENHLGLPVSHGCIRLGSENAEILYNWAEKGTLVYIY